MNKQTLLKTFLVTLVLFLLGIVIYPVIDQSGAISVYAEANGNPVIPENTTVNIFKLQASEEVFTSLGYPQENRDGEMLDISILRGPGITPLSGVTFGAYKLSADKMREYDVAARSSNKSLYEYAQEQLFRSESEAKSAQQTLEEYFNANAASLGLTPINVVGAGSTGADGRVTWTVNKSENGTYWVIEKSAPDSVSRGLAIPFQITFPMAASNGTGYLSTVNIYPKNFVADLPKAGKDVTTLGNNHSGYTVGEDNIWFLKGTIPTNIKNYEVYEFEDTLDSGLTYVRVDEVKAGDTLLTMVTDYSVTTSGQTVKIALTSDGIKKIAHARSIVKGYYSEDTIRDARVNINSTPFIQVKLVTRMNATAAIGEKIENKIKINFDNKPDGKTEIKSSLYSDVPEVHTGGSKFIKRAAGTQNSLANAEFDLLDSNGILVRWTQELLLANDLSMFVSPSDGQPIKFRSKSDGTFSIRGLGYGIDGQTEVDGTSTYKLRETKAPVGYVIPQETVDFTVSKTSFDNVAIEGGVLTSSNQIIINNNERPAIPNTGGIGSVLFVVVGLGVMCFACRGLRKGKYQR